MEGFRSRNRVNQCLTLGEAWLRRHSPPSMACRERLPNQEDADVIGLTLEQWDRDQTCSQISTLTIGGNALLKAIASCASSFWPLSWTRQLSLNTTRQVERLEAYLIKETTLIFVICLPATLWHPPSIDYSCKLIVQLLERWPCVTANINHCLRIAFIFTSLGIILEGNLL
jgi:hypothetical protein